MINIEQILSLPPDKRDLEIRNLIVPKPWKHDVEDIRRGSVPTPLKKCRKCEQCYPIRHSFCPIPDPIALDWNLAMKMRDDILDQPEITFGIWYDACKTVINKSYINSEEKVAQWFLLHAQPHHCLLAAIVAKESKDE